MESKDRQDRIHALEVLEGKLTNGSRGDINVMSDFLVEQGRAIKLMLAIDFMKSEDCYMNKDGECPQIKAGKQHPINWPTAAIIATILGIIWRILTTGGPVA